MSKPAEQDDPRTCFCVGGEAVRFGPVFPWPGTRLPGYHNEKFGAGCAKEDLVEHGALPSRALGALGGDDLPNNETTLGNGYLGSRIDEERSEMRYLV